VGRVARINQCRLLVGECSGLPQERFGGLRQGLDSSLTGNLDNPTSQSPLSSVRQTPKVN